MSTGEAMFLKLIRLRRYLLGRPGLAAVLFTWFRPFAGLVRAGETVFLAFALAIVLVVHVLSWVAPTVTSVGSFRRGADIRRLGAA
jgi:hypothetical protein